MDREKQEAKKESEGYSYKICITPGATRKEGKYNPSRARTLTVRAQTSGEALEKAALENPHYRVISIDLRD